MKKYQQQMADIINSSTTKTTITLARQSGKQTYNWYDEINNTRFNQRYDWCLANLGPGLESPPRWEPIGIGNPTFKFRDPADHLWFKLRWGE
jgi:hypothetical protein